VARKYLRGFCPVPLSSCPSRFALAPAHVAGFGRGIFPGKHSLQFVSGAFQIVDVPTKGHPQGRPSPWVFFSQTKAPSDEVPRSIRFLLAGPFFPKFPCLFFLTPFIFPKLWRFQPHLVLSIISFPVSPIASGCRNTSFWFPLPQTLVYLFFMSFATYPLSAGKSFFPLLIPFVTSLGPQPHWIVIMFFPRLFPGTSFFSPEWEFWVARFRFVFSPKKRV